MVKLFFFLLTVWVVVQGNVPGNPALMYPGSADRAHNAPAYGTYLTEISDIRQ